MSRIEASLPIHANLEDIYAAISAVENIPNYAPGIREAASIDDAPEAATTFLDLVTRSGRHLDGKVVQRRPNQAFAVRDANGTIARWALETTPEGVVATYSLEGDFDTSHEAMLRSEMRAKLARLVLDLERRP